MQNKEWIIQRCINAFKNEYENWHGYCEKLLTRDEMLETLKVCERECPNYEFRGHRVIINSVPRKDLITKFC